MFHNTEHQRQILGPECYTSEEFHRWEVRDLLLPAWHCVGALSDLPQDGAFCTLTLFGRPLLLWRSEGRVHAFLNVCSHRYAQLTHKRSGRLALLKCQYHGWEYDCTGNTRCIPDARSFRPLAPGVLGLKKYRCETAGQLIFVSLASDGPSLADYLGPAFDLANEWYHDDLQPAIDWNREIPCNWKIPIENALESYHTTAVHPQTFGAFPAEEHCAHAFHDGGSSMVVDYSGERSLRRLLDDYAHWNCGLAPRHRYEHHAIYPNLTFARLSLYTTFECMIPISPARTLRIGRIFCHAGPRGRLWTRWMAMWVRSYGKRLLCRISDEDCRVLPGVQEGFASPDLPSGGLISTREERIVHFQHYIATRAQQWEVPDCEENQLNLDLATRS